MYNGPNASVWDGENWIDGPESDSDEDYSPSPRTPSNGSAQEAVLEYQRAENLQREIEAYEEDCRVEEEELDLVEVGLCLREFYDGAQLIKTKTSNYFSNFI